MAWIRPFRRSLETRASSRLRRMRFFSRDFLSSRGRFLGLEVGGESVGVASEVVVGGGATRREGCGGRGKDVVGGWADCMTGWAAVEGTEVGGATPRR